MQSQKLIWYGPKPNQTEKNKMNVICCLFYLQIYNFLEIYQINILHFFTNLYIFSLFGILASASYRSIFFYGSHCSKCVVAYHCFFNLHFYKTLFLYLCTVVYIVIHNPFVSTIRFPTQSLSPLYPGPCYHSSHSYFWIPVYSQACLFLAGTAIYFKLLFTVKW